MWRGWRGLGIRGGGRVLTVLPCIRKGLTKEESGRRFLASNFEAGPIEYL